MDLWNRIVEQEFFQKVIYNFASPEQLFYVTDDNRYVAYWPNNYQGKKSTLQSRNALIGQFSETWTRELLANCVKTENLFAVQGAACKEIGLSTRSPADIVIAKRNRTELAPEDILMIFEVKMSVVWNWELQNNQLICLGDYKTHQGTPGLLRSDSMLKAIGKAVNIRTSSRSASTIPIIVLGNTPITRYYFKKVDNLKKSGIVQGFLSINPQPLDGEDTIKATKKEGFIRCDSYESLKRSLVDLLSMDLNFFSRAKSKEELGRLIEIADREPTYEQKAETFLKLLESEENG
jgi:3-hydroxymyristoyl/3-hydroxydecanoyl-(acyl carrier protein) dehydratase